MERFLVRQPRVFAELERLFLGDQVRFIVAVGINQQLGLELPGHGRDVTVAVAMPLAGGEFQENIVLGRQDRVFLGDVAGVGKNVDDPFFLDCRVVRPGVDRLDRRFPVHNYNFSPQLSCLPAIFSNVSRLEITDLDPRKELDRQLAPGFPFEFCQAGDDLFHVRGVNVVGDGERRVAADLRFADERRGQERPVTEDRVRVEVDPGTQVIHIHRHVLLYNNMNKQVEPRCPYFGTCGGCQLQHLAYENQLELKTRLVRDQMAQQGVEGIEVKRTLGMDDPWFYRNKIQFPIREQNNRLQMGYFKQKTHEVVNIKECYIQDPFLTEIAQIAREVFEDRELSAYDEKNGTGLLRHFIGRSGFRTHELLLGIVVNGRGLPAGFTVADEIKKRERLMQRQVARHQDYPRYPEKVRIVGIVQNINTAKTNVILGRQNTVLLGMPSFREKLGSHAFKIQLPSFFQVNPVQAEILYDLARDYAELSGVETVVDAYAGIGTIAIWLARSAAEVIGVEERPEAVKDAIQCLALNKVANVKMVAGTIEQVFPKRADVVVLDPPRAGCSEKALKGVVRADPRRIVYISCNPETLARDLKVLAQNKYKVEIVQPVDMFPQTDHVEVVARLSRSG